MSAVLFAVTRDRSITCEKFWPEFHIARPGRWWPKIMPYWTVIVAASPSLAYTADVSFRVHREEKTELSFPELENLLNRGVNQEFIKYRKIASQALGVPDLDVVLADSRVIDFRIDGHRVHNPIGFTPQELQTAIEITFVQRKLYESLRNLIRRPNFFFTSLAEAKLTALRKAYKPPFALAVFESPQSSVFRAADSETGRMDERRDIPWSAKEYLEVFIETWGVNEEIARDLYGLYQKKQLPTAIEEQLQKKFKDVSEHLEESLKKIGAPTKILITSQEDVHLASRRFSFEPISIQTLLEKMGFSVPGEAWPMPSYEQFSYCAPLLDFFSDQGSPEINRWLRRRLHWLGSMNYN